MFSKILSIYLIFTSLTVGASYPVGYDSFGTSNLAYEYRAGAHLSEEEIDIEIRSLISKIRDIAEENGSSQTSTSLIEESDARKKLAVRISQFMFVSNSCDYNTLPFIQELKSIGYSTPTPYLDYKCDYENIYVDNKLLWKALQTEGASQEYNTILKKIIWETDHAIFVRMRPHISSKALQETAAACMLLGVINFGKFSSDSQNLGLILEKCMSTIHLTLNTMTLPLDYETL